jgi:hypothetical protein
MKTIDWCKNRYTDQLNINTSAEISIVFMAIWINHKCEDNRERIIVSELFLEKLGTHIHSNINFSIKLNVENFWKDSWKKLFLTMGLAMIL